MCCPHLLQKGCRAKTFGDPLYPSHYALFGRTRGVIANSCYRILKLCTRPYVTKILRFQTPKCWGPTVLCTIGVDKGGQGVISKSCLRVLKLCICLLIGWGRCFKMTLRTHAPTNFRSCWWGAERSVTRAQTREQESPSAWAEYSITFMFVDVTWVFRQKLSDTWSICCISSNLCPCVCQNHSYLLFWIYIYCKWKFYENCLLCLLTAQLKFPSQYCFLGS